MPKYFLTGFIMATVLISCGDITQEMWLKEDGSGELHLAYDVSQMLALYKMMGDMSKDADENEGGQVWQQGRAGRFSGFRIDWTPRHCSRLSISAP